ncbi:hypothetical protein [Hoeflea sp.]|uniref:hypothetical protein n=1 Tax=Hoeflea sp. TaxID=1940281 RepID=UPI003B011A5E
MSGRLTSVRRRGGARDLKDGVRRRPVPAHGKRQTDKAAPVRQDDAREREARRYADDCAPRRCEEEVLMT